MNNSAREQLARQTHRAFDYSACSNIAHAKAKVMPSAYASQAGRSHLRGCRVVTFGDTNYFIFQPPSKEITSHPVAAAKMSFPFVVRETAAHCHADRSTCLRVSPRRRRRRRSSAKEWKGNPTRRSLALGEKVLLAVRLHTAIVPASVRDWNWNPFRILCRQQGAGPFPRLVVSCIGLDGG